MKEFKLEYDLVNAMDLTGWAKCISRADCREHFLMDAGQEHYKLLAYLATHVESHIVELGTHVGTSAVAMASHTDKMIFTYDVRDIYTSEEYPRDNIERYIENIMEDRIRCAMLNAADLIFIDTAHNGDFEKQVFDYLIDTEYKGWVVYDDITFNDAMKNFWSYVNLKCADYGHIVTDVTALGHGRNVNGVISGTGLIQFV